MAPDGGVQVAVAVVDVDDDDDVDCDEGVDVESVVEDLPPLRRVGVEKSQFGGGGGITGSSTGSGLLLRLAWSRSR